jgi:hypothetical protein
MAHDVFISHARKDKKIADAICEKLEAAELRCWIAPRDISRVIIPFRLAETLPRRDFLYYLGDVRRFDAFGPHPEQHLEA